MVDGGLCSPEVMLMFSNRADPLQTGVPISSESIQRITAPK
jgi:hypothetical protein